MHDLIADCIQFVNAGSNLKATQYPELSLRTHEKGIVTRRSREEEVGQAVKCRQELLKAQKRYFSRLATYGQLEYRHLARTCIGSSRIFQCQQSEFCCLQDLIFTEVRERGPSESASIADDNDDKPVGKGSVVHDLTTFIKGRAIFPCDIKSLSRQAVDHETLRIAVISKLLSHAHALISLAEKACNFAGFVLPRGFPNSVTPDYLEYQLRCLPAHITGWISKSLATSSLIHALNVGPVGPSGTVAASAAIKWITKDGIGAFGRFLVILASF